MSESSDRRRTPRAIALRAGAIVAVLFALIGLLATLQVAAAMLAAAGGFAGGALLFGSVAAIRGRK